MTEGFIFYQSFYDAINDLDDADQLIVYRAICEYGLTGEEPELSGVASAMFKLIKPQIDANAKRRENGKKGGRPQNKETEEKPNENQTETKDKPNHNQTITEVKPKEKEKEKVKEKVKDKAKDKDKAKGNDKEKDCKEKASPKGDAKKKFPHGEYQNVLLTDDEFIRLANDLGQGLRDECIKFLDEYIEEKGYKSKSHNLSIRRWVVGAVNEHKKKASPKDSMQKAIEIFMRDDE